MSISFMVPHDPNWKVQALQLERLVQDDDGDYVISDEDGRQVQQLTDDGWSVLAVDFEKKQILFEKRPPVEKHIEQGDQQP